MLAWRKCRTTSACIENSALNTIFPLIRVAQVLAQQYDVVVTNPPYMGSSNMDVRLSEFVKKHYPDSKSDLFAVFIERCGQMTGKKPLSGDDHPARLDVPVQL